jgi:hypothetical protein
MGMILNLISIRNPLEYWPALTTHAINSAVVRIYSHVSGGPWLIITGFGLDDWMYWHFYCNYSYLQSIITAQNRWLPKTRSTPSWTTSVFSSTVNDLVLIYGSVTSSASVVRWLTLQQLNTPYEGWLLYDCFLQYEYFLQLTCTNDICLTANELHVLL